MNPLMNKVKYFPLFKHMRAETSLNIANQRSSKKKIVYKEVKALREAIDEFKLEVDPVEILKKTRKANIERKKREKALVDREKERNKLNEKLSNYRRSYSNMMILQQMTRNKQYYKQEIEKRSPFKTVFDSEKKTTQIDASMCLTTRMHNSSSMRTMKKNSHLSTLEGRFPFHLNSSTKPKRYKFTACTQSTHYEIKCDNNSLGEAKEKVKRHMQKSMSVSSSRNNKRSIRREIDAVFQSCIVENNFKRSPSQPKYNLIQGKLNDYTSKHCPLGYFEAGLGQMASQYKQVETINHDLALSIYDSNKDRMQLLPIKPKKKREEEFIIDKINDTELTTKLSFGIISAEPKPKLKRRSKSDKISTKGLGNNASRNHNSVFINQKSVFNRKFL